MTHHGSTLIEISVAAAVSAVLCSTSAANKTSAAGALVLRQALLGYIPRQMQRYYLSGDAAAWVNQAAKIHNAISSWRLIK